MSSMFKCNTWAEEMPFIFQTFNITQIAYPTIKINMLISSFSTLQGMTPLFNIHKDGHTAKNVLKYISVSKVVLKVQHYHGI